MNHPNRDKVHSSPVHFDQNMMIPELSGIHVNSSFDVSSYFGQSVNSSKYIHLKNLVHNGPIQTLFQKKI